MDWSRWCSDSRYTKEEERDARKQIGLDVYQGDFIEYLTGWPPEKSEAVNLNHFRSVLTEPLTFCGFEPLSHLPDVRMRVLSLIDAGSQNVKELQPVLPVKGTS